VENSVGEKPNWQLDHGQKPVWSPLPGSWGHKTPGEEAWA